MSKLEYMMRPLVAFDPANKDHRRYYAEFLEYGGWGRCPVRFVCPEDFGQDLPTMIKNKLIDYYVGREFGGFYNLGKARQEDLRKAADELYKKAARLRKEADLLEKPRRT